MPRCSPPFWIVILALRVSPNLLDYEEEEEEEEEENLQFLDLLPQVKRAMLMSIIVKGILKNSQLALDAFP